MAVVVVVVEDGTSQKTRSQDGLIIRRRIRNHKVVEGGIRMGGVINQSDRET